MQAPPDYARAVRPILERSCIRCHGPAHQQGGLRLDSRRGALRVVLAHNANGSPLIQRVSAASEDQRMPPVSSGLPRLTPGELATLRAWIDAGPSWPPSEASPGDTGRKPHWSLQPLRRPPLPAPTGNPIDAFIRVRLRAKALGFSPAADRPTLLRRVYYDLTGLPPTPEDVSAFVRDTKPGAYERVVDRLLASPRYGERWARHWLDTIHFADSHGFEHDIGRDNAWPFRDYVIQSFNADLPWSRFVQEQLAADFLFPDQPQRTPALGFLGAGTFDLSAYNTAPQNFELLDRDDLVTQTMSAFTGTTANCARCHTHKFDPIPQADYYALQAVFAGLTKGERTYDASAAVGRARAQASALLAAANRQESGVLLAAENAAVVERWQRRAALRPRWQPVTLVSFSSAEGATLRPGPEDSIVSEGKRPETDTYTTVFTSPLRTVTAVRLDVLASDSLPQHGPGRQDNGNLHLSEIEVQVVEPGQAPRRLALGSASADFNQTDWGIERALDGDLKTAWGIYPAVGKPHYGVFPLAQPCPLSPGARLIVVLHQNHGTGHLIGRYRLSVLESDPRDAGALPAETEALLAVPEAQRTGTQRLALAAAALGDEARRALAALPPPARVFAAGASVDVPTVGVRTIAEPRPVHRLERGELDQPRERVGPGALSALPLPARFALKDPKNEAERRAALAGWLTHRDNVLTWRTIVNRVWHYHFGRGLCDTPNDLGQMGGVPSHPELIDWLAVWFRDDARGSLKTLHRLIVTSETYRQSSASRADGVARDSENRLLWRQNAPRLDAEAYHDFALAVSGTLDLTLGGPGVKQFVMSPGPQLTPSLDYTAYNWSSAGAGRRSIYRYVWRGIADPFLEALDFPDLGLLAPTRTFSVSALQALALYNDAFVLHCSAALAGRVSREATGLDAQVAQAVLRVWLRPPTPAEQATLTAFARQHGLPALCRVLLNSNAFLFVR